MNIEKIILVYFLFLATNLSAQNYNFESNNAGWSATQGSLSLSNNHFKQGTQSLCWQTSGQSQLEVSGFTVSTTATNCANMFIYSTSITNDTMMVEFMNGNTVLKSGKYLFNYKGWHEFKRWYASYSNSGNVSINKLRFTLKPTTTDTRNIYFDDVQLSQAINSSADILGSHWALDFDVLEWVGARLDPHYLKDPYRLFANPRDLPLTTPTTEELSSLNTLRTQFKSNPSYYVTATANAKIYVDGLNLTRNADGTINGGPILDLSSAAIALSTINDVVTPQLAALAGAAKANKTDAQTYFNLLFDYAIDQGMGEGCPIFASSNAYDDVRTLTGNWFKILGGCNDDARYQEALKAMKWYSYYGAMYNPQASYLNCINSDVLYLLTTPIMNAIAAEKEDATAVRELRAFKRYIERSVNYVPGASNMLKADGTGFHHGVHYINYMRSYNPITDAFSWLKATPFKINAEAYQNFRKAVITNYILSTKDAGDNHSYALSLSGRSPFSSNQNISYSKSNFEALILAGRDCMGTATEPVLEGAYNYFFNSTKYNVAATSYDGFFQFNYSPAGIYRKDNWVITMRCPTTKLWGSEIYSKTNRFGRYQSSGSLDVNYSGTNFSVSGYPTNSTGGGWDWNVAPGTTTVHYTDWKKMMPSENLTQRFDQYNKSSNFSGALSFNDIGMFGCDFTQRDSWTETGSSQFTSAPTNLTFKKSMYCFDDMVIALGSNIGTSGSYPTDMITATNLFQEIVGTAKTDLIVNAVSKTNGYTATVESTQDNWVITPLGTGYFVPKGNDPLVIKYEDQTTPKSDGSDVAAPSTTATVVKAYLSHGYKTSDKTYCYILKPAATAEIMNEIAAAANNNSLYKIERQDALMHAITYYPKNIIAYCFYQAVSNLNFGIVKSTTSEHLLIDRKDDATGRHYFAISNPDLHPSDDLRSPLNYEWLANPSSTTLTLNGEYYPLENVAGVYFYPPINGTTSVNVTMKEGEPIYFCAKLGTDTKVESTNSENWISMKKMGENLEFKNNEMNQFTVTLCSVDGKQIAKKNGSGAISIHIRKLSKGVYFSHVTDGIKNKTFKSIIND